MNKCPCYYLPSIHSRQTRIFIQYGSTLTNGLKEELNELEIALQKQDHHMVIDSLYDLQGYLLMIIHALDAKPVPNIAIWIQHQKDRGREHRHWYDQMTLIAESLPLNGDDIPKTEEIINRVNLKSAAALHQKDGESS